MNRWCSPVVLLNISSYQYTLSILKQYLKQFQFNFNSETISKTVSILIFHSIDTQVPVQPPPSFLSIKLINLDDVYTQYTSLVTIIFFIKISNFMYSVFSLW